MLLKLYNASCKGVLCMTEKAAASESFMILQKVFDMIQYAYPALAQYPKSEKFSLVTDIKHILDEMLELTIEAQKKYYKKTTLQELDVTTLNHLVKEIIVHEQIDEAKERHITVEIHFNLQPIPEIECLTSSITD